MTTKRLYSVTVEANFTILAESPTHVTDRIKKTLSKEGFDNKNWEIFVGRYRQNRPSDAPEDAPESDFSRQESLSIKEISPVSPAENKKLQNKPKAAKTRQRYASKSLQNRKKRGSK